jgi:FkbM family methyltransferase
VSSLRHPARRPVDRETRVSHLAATVPIVRRLWLGATAYQYRRARGLFGPRQVPVFALREGHARAASADATVYTLRDSGLRVALRHGTTDSGVLEEVFNRRCYAFPEPVQAMLGRLGRPPRILDLGGHIGLFALYVLGRYPGAEITSVEADPNNLRLLDTCVRLNAREQRWTIVPACAGVAEGTANFVSCGTAHGGFSRSYVARSSGPGCLEIPVCDVFPLMEGVDLVKFDIQGSEWEVLRDPRLGQVLPRVVVLEYHPYLCPEANAFSCAARLLTSAGYELGPHAESIDGEGTLWAWSRSRVHAT